MNFNKKFLQLFSIGLVLLIILNGCSSQDENWVYEVNSKIVDDKS